MVDVKCLKKVDKSVSYILTLFNCHFVWLVEKESDKSLKKSWFSTLQIRLSKSMSIFYRHSLCYNKSLRRTMLRCVRLLLAFAWCVIRYALLRILAIIRFPWTIINNIAWEPYLLPDTFDFQAFALLSLLGLSSNAEAHANMIYFSLVDNLLQVIIYTQA